MTVIELIERLQKIDKDKMVLHTDFDLTGWSNIELRELNHSVLIVPCQHEFTK